MNINSPTLIISDLHLGHPASYVVDPEQITPLIKDVGVVVFNGDTSELVFKHKREKAQRDVSQIKQICEDHNVQSIFINGNHDPFVSSFSHLDLFNETVLVTHGDILFHKITPWSENAEALAYEHSRILSNLPQNGHSEFEKQLQAVKMASFEVENKLAFVPRSRPDYWHMVKKAVWPPKRLFALLKFWLETPGLAVNLAARFRPMAKYIIIGHTHRSGIWQMGQRTVINTGSFMPFSGRTGVVLENGMLSVRKIKMRNKQFTLGRTITKYTNSFDVTPVKSGTLINADQH